LCRMILTSPADACANPMHGIIAGVARESAFLPHWPFESDSASDSASSSMGFAA